MYLYKSMVWSCIEYCCHVWDGAPSCYLELLDKLQKWICRTAGPSVASSLEPLAHCQNIAMLSLSIGITVVDVHLNWLIWFHFLILEGGLLVIWIYCTIFLSPFLCVTRMLCQQQACNFSSFYRNSSFLNFFCWKIHFWDSHISEKKSGGLIIYICFTKYRRSRH